MLSNPFEGYRISSPYGWRIHPVYGDRRFHTGIDLVKTHKAPIHAFVSGKVLFAGFGATGSGFGNYGNVVAIGDEQGRLHCYCHLDSISVKVGQTVVRGQEVGKQGNTGVGTGSHLHYEIRKKSSPSYGYADAEHRCYEPTKYLVDWYSKDKEDNEYMLKPEDANKIIAFMGAVWQLVDTPAPTNEGQNEVNRLANELRKASGQPTT